MFFSALLAVVTLALPLAVWLGHGQVEPRLIACLLGVAALLRALTAGSGSSLRWTVAGAVLLAAAALLGNAWMPLKLYPVLINTVMLAVFGHSLLYPPSIIERIARRQDPDLPPAAVQYTRRVTQVWCAFFLVNGTIALSTAVWASTEVWSLYNGVIAYLMMGLLFGGEYIIRLRFKRLHNV